MPRHVPIRRARATAATAVLVAALAACTPVTHPAPSDPTSAPSAGQGTDQWRPATHFTPSQNWMNDPNGLVLHDGIYHLFYQYNPHGNFWGDMSWGHATSTDLVHWDEQPVAMAATEQEEIFSGSIVVDATNSSGLGSIDNPAFVALYTSVYGEGSGHEPGVQAQSVAYSLDQGQTWQKYEHNPVLTLDPESKSFRDPKVLWYDGGSPDTSYWVMSTVVADDQVVKLYRSDDLLTWDFLSDFRGMGVGADDPAILWEMPDLFPLTIEGSDEAKWVMLLSINPGSVAGGSGMQYFVGTFDGTTFIPEDVAPAGSDLADFDWVDHGADFYAATSVSGVIDGATVIGWLGNWDYATDIPTTPWRGAMAIPRSLALRMIDGHPKLISQIADPALRALESGNSTEVGDLKIEEGVHAAPPTTCSPQQLVRLSVDPSTGARAGLVLRGPADGSRGTRVLYDPDASTLTLDRSTSGITNFSAKFSTEHIVNLPRRDGPLDLTVLVDASSVEVFADSGATAITDLVLPPGQDTCTSLVTEGGEATFSGVRIVTPDS